MNYYIKKYLKYKIKYLNYIKNEKILGGKGRRNRSRKKSRKRSRKK